jgi:Tol biopolymer transport system component
MSMSTRKAKPEDPGVLERRHKRQRRWSVGKKVGPFALVAAIGLAAVASSIFGALGGQNATTPAGQTPTVAPGTSSEAQPRVAVADSALADNAREVDYVIDLNTGAMTPLPKAIIRSLGQTYESGQYAASPDGSLLAYVGTGNEGSLQIFIAGIDGSGIRQMTHDPTGAASPAWSPDGRTIAYTGYGSGDVRNFFVLDVATGETRQVTDGTRDVWEPQFTPDGSSLIYTGRTNQGPSLVTVPVAGGKSTLLIRPSEGLTHVGNGSLSPDGSLVTFLGGEWPKEGPGHCGPCRFVANADGTERRVIPGGMSNPAGTWSPDGSRIVANDVTDALPDAFIVIVDIATGNASRVAAGSAAIWLDRHTLLVEV